MCTGGIGSRPSTPTDQFRGIVQGDGIIVFSNGRELDEGVFIEVRGGFLYWVADGGGNAVLTATSLDGITVVKQNV